MSRLASCLGLLIVLSVFCVGSVAGQSPSQQARDIINVTGVKAGLAVHIGCGDGQLAEALHSAGTFVVHGLDTDPAAIEAARRNIRKAGLYGPVSVEQFDGKTLPYADNLVNLIIADSLGDVPKDQAMRVLAPGGVLCTKVDGKWTKTVKPKPSNTDEWTHYLHDASGNAVSNDTAVGPPRYVQWIAGPRHTRSHEHLPGISTMVSAGGKVFYFEDEGPIASVKEPSKWYLVARDAYNGVLLWQRRLDKWFPHLMNWGMMPQQLERKLVAVGDRLYVSLGLEAPLSVVDAETGRTLKVYDQTNDAEEILYYKGVIIVVDKAVTAQRTSELASLVKLEMPDDSPLHARETAEPLMKHYLSTEARAIRRIMAFEASTGGLLWQKTGPDGNRLRPVSLCAAGDCVYYQRGPETVCADLRSGSQRWAVSAGTLRVVGAGEVFCGAGDKMTALSGETGKELWAQKPLLCDIRDTFVIGDSLWLGGFKPIENKRSPVWGPYFATGRDLKTGAVKMEIDPENPGHHHRCWRNKATPRYILGGRRGVEYIDLQTGNVQWDSWVRGVCKYGVMPGNGLLYAPPHSCGCYIAAKLTGFYALASETESPLSASNDRLDSFATLPAGKSTTTTAGDWPTYRHDAGRSGATEAAVPGRLKQLWKVDAGVKITGPTIAGGGVFVAAVDEQRVCAFDAGSGKPMWDFTTSARVDSPPTVEDSRAVFGSCDGYVYCVNAADGSPLWRLRPGRSERRVMVNGQLESVLPVHGSVLVDHGVAYATAGRSSYLDGGIDLYRLNADTGKVLSRTPIYSPDPDTGQQPEQEGPCYMPGSLGEILTCDKDNVYLRDLVLDKAGQVTKRAALHLFTMTGFLDDTWPHRSFWVYGTKCTMSTGCSGRDKNIIFGRILVVDEPTVYGYGRADVHWSNQLLDKPYRLFAHNIGEKNDRWTLSVPIYVRAMLKAGDVIFAAGPKVEADDRQWNQNDEGKPAVLMAISASDGSVLARYPLESSPVFDGMAAAGGRLYMSLENGRLLCMAGGL